MSIRVIVFLFTLLAAPIAFGAAFFQAGASCAPVNNSVSTKTKFNYGGVINNSAGTRWIICPVIHETLSTSNDTEVVLALLNNNSEAVEVPCYFRYLSVDEGLVTLTRSVAISSNDEAQATFSVINEAAVGMSLTCGLKPNTGIWFLGTETTY